MKNKKLSNKVNIKNISKKKVKRHSKKKNLKGGSDNFICPHCSSIINIQNIKKSTGSFNKSFFKTLLTNITIGMFGCSKCNKVISIGAITKFS